MNRIFQYNLKLAGIDGYEDAIITAGALEVKRCIIKGLKKGLEMVIVVVDLLEADNVGLGVAKNLGNLTKAVAPLTDVWVIETLGKGIMEVAVGEAVPGDY